MRYKQCKVQNDIDRHTTGAHLPSTNGIMINTISAVTN